AWTFLGFGLLLGARWSSSELGWGGYWAWDPVENAALMPFLLGTAFLHSILVQEKRNMLKGWNATLIVATFSMCLLGARWSYSELGWGSYWAWDPVENAALMPFLLGPAFLHSIMVQEKR